ncbi:MAG TPA: VWA domain-containing protein, partial [Herpetosiphonaceae bacterium]
SVDLLIAFNAEADGAHIAAARRPLNLSLVIDRSGSMAGRPLKQAIKAAQSLIDHLSADDMLSIVTYDDEVTTLLHPQQVVDKQAVKALLNTVRAGGCTNLSGGWLKGCELVRANQGRELVQRVLLLTDGQANSGITDSAILVNTARQQADAGVITTTLGFGNNFNEDVLIGMANAAGGNFYFIQSPDDAAEVFAIEMQGLTAVAAQNLTVTVEPVAPAQLTEVLNNYRSRPVGAGLEITLGDVYATEDKLLALELALPAGLAPGDLPLIRLRYAYHTVIDGAIQLEQGELGAALEVVAGEQPPVNAAVLEQTSRLRIAKVKEEAIELADRGDYQRAAQRLRGTIAEIQRAPLQESFELAEELDQLEHYAQRIGNRSFDTVTRKEMRDQSYQARTRTRADLQQRGLASGSARELEAITAVDSGVTVECFRAGGKLRIRVVADGYDPTMNVQFPRHIREEGVTYVVDAIEEAASGTFYRAVGRIRRLVLPGQENRYAATGSVRRGSAQAAKVQGTAADLDTTDTVGEGVLVQCIKDGSKLRARVVSDGYDPTYNMRFPRSIREDGMLYVVDEVIQSGGSNSYIACGKIKRFVQ